MKILSLLSVILVSQLIQQTYAQQTNWGESTWGAQLSFNLTNMVISAVETTTLQCKIKNSSTNFINVVEVNPMTDFSVFLINDAGVSRKLTPDASSAVFYRIVHKLNASQVYECSVAIKIEKDVEPGDYTLKATRHILTADSKSCEITSNLLKVKVVR
jgi:hypothetical protein